MWTQSFQKSGLIAISAIAFLFFSALYAIPNFIRILITQKMVISSETNYELYSTWIHAPAPLFHKVYLFNVSNPKEILEGMPPRLNEIGPFVFRINKTKVDVTFDDENDIVSFNEHNNYYFDEELSKPLKLDQVVTLINVPYVGAAVKIGRDFIWPLSHIAHMVLLNYKEPIFIEKTAEELIFKGYKVPFLERLEEDAHISFLPNNTFAYFFGLNDSLKGPFTVHTGVNPSKPVGSIVEYKNKTTVEVWPGGCNATCNQIKGSDGTIFPPFIEKDDFVYIFISDLCSTTDFKYSSDVSIHGIDGYRLTIPMELIEDRDRSACYCKTGNTDRDKCFGQGVVDLAPCRDGHPVALSQVHFLNADPKYVEKIGDGIKPDIEKHQAFVELEPLLGVPLRIAKRVQLNLILERVSSIPGLDKVDNMLFPLFWMEEGFTLDEKSAGRVKKVLGFIYFVGYFSKLVAILGSFILLTFEIRKMKQLKCKEKRTELIAKQSVNYNEKHMNCKNFINEESVALASK